MTNETLTHRKIWLLIFFNFSCRPSKLPIFVPFVAEKDGNGEIYIRTYLRRQNQLYKNIHLVK